MYQVGGIYIFFIIGAVKKNIRKDDSEIENVIKVWLKHAPQRVKNSTQLNQRKHLNT